MDKYVHVQENIFFGLMTKHNNTPYPYFVSINMIMSIGNHECRLLVDKYPGRDNPRVDRSTVRAMVFNATSTTLVVIGSDCKSNYHPITTTTAVTVVHIVISLFKVCSFSSMDRLSYITVNAFTDHLKGVYKHLLTIWKGCINIYFICPLDLPHVLIRANHNRYWTKTNRALSIKKGFTKMPDLFAFLCANITMFA